MNSNQPQQTGPYQQQTGQYQQTGPYQQHPQQVVYVTGQPQYSATTPGPVQTGYVAQPYSPMNPNQQGYPQQQHGQYKQPVSCCSPFDSACTLYKNNCCSFIGAGFIIFGIMAAIAFIIAIINPFNFYRYDYSVTPMVIMGSASFVVQIFLLLFSTGVVNASVQASEGQLVRFSHFFSGFTKHFCLTFGYLGILFLIGLIYSVVLAGFSFLFVYIFQAGGVTITMIIILVGNVFVFALMIHLSFTLIIGIKENIGAWKAASASIKFVKINFCYIFGFYLLCALIAMGLSLTIIGLLFVTPLLTLAQVQVHYQLSQ